MAIQANVIDPETGYLLRTEYVPDGEPLPENSILEPLPRAEPLVRPRWAYGAWVEGIPESATLEEVREAQQRRVQLASLASYSLLYEDDRLLVLELHNRYENGFTSERLAAALRYKADYEAKVQRIMASRDRAEIERTEWPHPTAEEL